MRIVSVTMQIRKIIETNDGKTFIRYSSGDWVQLVGPEGGESEKDVSSGTAVLLELAYQRYEPL